MMTQTGVIVRPLAIIMNREVRTIGPNASAADAAILMRNFRVGALLVFDEGTYLGVVSETDLVRKAMAVGLDPSQARVRTIMSSPLITIEVDRSAHDANDLMADKGIRHLGVTQDGQLAGVISVRDLLRYFKNWGSV